LRIELTHGIVFDDDEEKYHDFVKKYDCNPDVIQFLNSPSMFGVYPPSNSTPNEIFDMIMDKMVEGRVQYIRANKELPIISSMTDSRWWLDGDGELVRPLLDVEKVLETGFRVGGLVVGDGSKSVEKRKNSPITRGKGL
jgi:hypothetical protein